MTSKFSQKVRVLFAGDRLRKSAAAFGGTVVLTSLVVSGLVVILRQLGALQGFELSAYDRMIRMRPEEGIDDRILVVGVSEEDIQTRKEYPIQDSTLAKLLSKVLQDQPRAIGVDIARDVPQGEGRDALTAQFAGSDRIVAACLLSSTDSPGLPAPPGVPPDRIAFADLPQDPDGVIRRSILVSTPGVSAAPLPESHLCNQANPDNQLVSLSLSLSILYLRPEKIVPEQTGNGEIKLGSALFKPLTEQAGSYQNSGASDYQVMLNYRSLKGIRQVNLTQVLEGQVDPSWIKDRVVLIGYTSEVAKDNFYTPFSAAQQDNRSMPGVVVHAQSVSQMINAALGQRSLIWYWSQGVEALWIWGWAIAGGTITWMVRKPWLFVIAEGVALGIGCGLCYLIFLQSGWVPLVPSAIALATTAVGVLLLDRAHEGGYTEAIYEQAKEQIKSVLSPKVEIDQERRARQVAEITNTTYFQDLVQRAKAIREKRSSEGLAESPSQLESGQNPDQNMD